METETRETWHCPFCGSELHYRENEDGNEEEYCTYCTYWDYTDPELRAAAEVAREELP